MREAPPARQLRRRLTRNAGEPENGAEQRARTAALAQRARDGQREERCGGEQHGSHAALRLAHGKTVERQAEDGGHDGRSEEAREDGPLAPGSGEARESDP